MLFDVNIEQHYITLGLRAKVVMENLSKLLRIRGVRLEIL